ncbi:hypothetical protein OTU49_017011 [Cherax quadricarinatus]|uniref:WAP domain-containing protein n=1 Tax=Cherax quadricarinatus TaxID=27406 RepID=A0AAW0YSL2_CHEQU
MTRLHVLLVLVITLILGSQSSAHGYQRFLRFAHHGGGFGNPGFFGRVIQGGNSGGFPGGNFGNGRFPGGNIGGGGFPGGNLGGGRFPGVNPGVGTTRPNTVSRPGGGSCPPARPACPATRARPQQCTADSECLQNRKCCFDSCVQTEVCKSVV